MKIDKIIKDLILIEKRKNRLSSERRIYDLNCLKDFSLNHKIQVLSGKEVLIDNDWKLKIRSLDYFAEDQSGNKKKFKYLDQFLKEVENESYLSRFRRGAK